MRPFFFRGAQLGHFSRETSTTKLTLYIKTLDPNHAHFRIFTPFPTIVLEALLGPLFLGGVGIGGIGGG